MVVKENEHRDDCSSDLEKEVKQVKEVESDYEPARDSLSSQGEAQSNEGNKAKRASRVPNKLTGKQSTDSGPRASRNATERRDNKLQFKASSNGQKKTQKPAKADSPRKNVSDKRSQNGKVPSKPPSEPSSEHSEGTEKSVEEFKEIDILDDAANCDQSVGTDAETVDTENQDDDQLNAYQKMEELQQKIEKLEEELREVAALEISLYSVVPEHGSSAHKVHTPARRLSRLYLHACKYWTPDKRATVVRNTVSGLVLVSKSCGNDVPRLTFWLSNTIILREIISQTFVISNSSRLSGVAESNGSLTDEGTYSTFKWKSNGHGKQMKGTDSVKQDDDWQETSTFNAALEKIESWIFSRIVESVWWQTLTPHMQSPMEDLYTSKNLGKLMGPALGDQQQGNFSISLWKSAFHDAFPRLCPLRAGGHECGCLPVLAKLVMAQCVSRLDIAMFNAILRESAHEIPTDPVSDPIVDAKVLPIPAGDLSFGSGAQLKNTIGNWSRCLSDLFGMDADDSIGDGEMVNDAERKGGDHEPKSFSLLNELSDLLMLPKDMLLDKAVRKEVCPSIGLSLITRVLCNFTPDEFCPDPVPAVVLEELNIEGMMEHRSSGKDLINSFPYTAAPVVYTPPSPADVEAKVADARGNARLSRTASIVQRKGYTSDDDLDDLDSPLTSLINKTPVSSPSSGPESLKDVTQVNVRYRLLREVWSE